MRNKLLWGVAATFLAGGLAMISVVNEDFALWGGIVLVAVALVLGLIAWKYKGGKQMQKEDKQHLIKDTEIKAKVEHAKEALGADFEGDYELDNVKVDLQVNNVERATGARFKSSNGSTPMTSIIMSCSKCGNRFPKAFTGHLPGETACPYCGHMNKVGK